MVESGHIWNSTPTPIYDELMSDKDTIPADVVRWPIMATQAPGEVRFNAYVGKLKNAYPHCKIDEFVGGKDRVQPTYGMPSSKYMHQPWNASQGLNYYADFKRQEKACQLQAIDPDIQGPQDLHAILVKQQKNVEMREASRVRAEEARYAAVPQGNLLGLSAQPVEMPNLLSFGPTKAGLNARAAELAGLNGRRDLMNVPPEVADMSEAEFDKWLALRKAKWRESNKKGGSRKTRKHRKGKKTRRSNRRR